MSSHENRRYTCGFRAVLRDDGPGPASVVVMLIAAVAVPSCAAWSNGDSAAVEHIRVQLDDLMQQRDELVRQHDAEVQRLDVVRAEIAFAQEVREAEEARAAWRKCLATQAEVESRAALLWAQCAEEVAEYERCRAEREAAASEGSLWGVLIGAAAAVVTGGAALPWAVGGAFGGNLLGREGSADCEAYPACVSTTRELRAATVLLEMGLDEMPTCEDEAEAGCVGEHFLFLTGQIESTDAMCDANEHAECAARTRAVAAGRVDVPPCESEPDQVEPAAAGPGLAEGGS